MIIQMFRCDNPECKSTAHPEDGSTAKRPITPYDWIYLTGHRQGYISYSITVCGIGCVSAALQAAERAEMER